MITEDQLDVKYPHGTPWWRKAPVEKYICNKHNKKTYWVRDDDVVAHDDDTECY